MTDAESPTDTIVAASTAAASPRPDETADTDENNNNNTAGSPSNVAVDNVEPSAEGSEPSSGAAASASEPSGNAEVPSSSADTNPVDDDPVPSPSSSPSPPDVSSLNLSTPTDDTTTPTTPTTNNAHGGGDTIVERDTTEAATRLADTITLALDTLLSFSYATPPHPLGAPNKLFTFSCNGRAANYQYRLEARPSHLAIHCTSPVRIPEAQRLLIAEFTARVNFGVLLGSLEIDLSDGELRYKIIQRNVSGLWDDARLIADLFVISLQMMDKFFPGIMAVTYANKTPAQAAQACEEQFEARHRQQQQASSEQ